MRENWMGQANGGAHLYTSLQDFDELLLCEGFQASVQYDLVKFGFVFQVFCPYACIRMSG